MTHIPIKRSLALTALLALGMPGRLWAAEGGWETLFAVDPGLMVWTVLIFFALMVFLRLAAWKPLLGALEARENGIRESIQEAQRMREEAEQLASDHRKQLAEARREAQQIIAEGRDAGQKLRADIEEKAKAEGTAMIERAKREIGQEKAAALEALRKESVELALSAASKLLGKNMDGETDRTLVVDYLAKLGSDGTGAEA